MASRSVARQRQPATKLSQSQILAQLGLPNADNPQIQAQIAGNGRFQQYMNMKAAAKGLPAPFDPSVASAIIQDVLPLAAIAGAGAVASDAGAAAATDAGAAADSGAASSGVASVAKKAALFGTIGAAVTSPLDFLKFIAWIFHPRNILRAVEFLVGIALMIFGLHAALQARGERIEGFTTSEGALTRSGLGRVATELGRAARGGSRPQRPRSAPHRTRQRALAQRYRREENLQRRGSQTKADVSRSKAPRPKK